MPVGSGAPKATTTPLSIRAASESRRAAYSAGAIACPWADTGAATHRSRLEQTLRRIGASPKQVGNLGWCFVQIDLLLVQLQRGPSRNQPPVPVAAMPPSTSDIEQHQGILLQQSGACRLEQGGECHRTGRIDIDTLHRLEQNTAAAGWTRRAPQSAGSAVFHRPDRS